MLTCAEIDDLRRIGSGAHFDFLALEPIFQTVMKGFITTAPLSNEAQKLLRDKDARQRIYKSLIGNTSTSISVNSGGTEFNVSATPAEQTESPTLKTGSDRR